MIFRSLKFSLVLSSTLSLATSPAMAQTSTQNANKKKLAQIAKKKTVGELLQQADRGGQIQAAAKQRAALPTVGPLAPVQKLAPEELAQVLSLIHI